MRSIKRFLEAIRSGSPIQTMLAIALFVLSGSLFSPSPPYPDTLSWSPDGSKIAVSGDGFLTVSDAASNQLLLDLPIGNTLVLNHDWSPDSTRLVSASDDQFIRIWNISGSGHTFGELLVSIGPVSDSGFVRYVDWKPDGQIIAVAVIGEGGALYLWDANTYQSAGIVVLGPLNHISWNPNTNINQIAYDDDEEGPGIITLTGQPPQSAPPIGGRDVVARTFVWNSNGTQLAVAYEDGETYVWDTETDTQIAILSAGDGIVVRSLAWSPNDQMIVTASGNGVIRLWNSITGELLQASPPLTGIVVDFSPDGTEVAYTISSDNVVIAPPVFSNVPPSATPDGL